MNEGKAREKTYNDQEIEARLKAELPRWYYRDGSSAANTRRMAGRARSW